MNIVASKIKKEKKDKKIIYSFEYLDENFEAHYYYGKKPEAELFHNGSSLGHIDNTKDKQDFAVNLEAKSIKISAWIVFNVYYNYIGKLNGMGVCIDDLPVQHTLADPDAHVKNGRSGFIVLFFLLLFKCIFTYYSNFLDYSSHLISAIFGMIYLYPLLLALIAFVKYAKWTKFALITGMIISVLEMLDYLIAVPNSLKSGAVGVTVIIWILIRVSAFCIFFNAFRWVLKKNDSN